MKIEVTIRIEKNENESNRNEITILDTNIKWSIISVKYSIEQYD